MVLVRVLACCHSTHWFLTAVILAEISVVRLMFATFILALMLVHYTDEELTNVCKHYHFTARHVVPEVASFVSGFSFTPRKIMVTVRRTLEPFQGRRWGNV